MLSCMLLAKTPASERSWGHVQKSPPLPSNCTSISTSVLKDNLHFVLARKTACHTTFHCDLCSWPLLFVHSWEMNTNQTCMQAVHPDKVTQTHMENEDKHSLESPPPSHIKTLAIRCYWVLSLTLLAHIDVCTGVTQNWCCLHQTNLLPVSEGYSVVKFCHMQSIWLHDQQGMGWTDIVPTFANSWRTAVLSHSLKSTCTDEVNSRMMGL